MRYSGLFAGSLLLIAGVFSAIAQVDKPPQLPDQYSQAVLQVEGMI